MKKTLSLFSSVIISVSGALTASAVVQNNHAINKTTKNSQQANPDNPQQIINDITTDHFYVPYGTDPDLSNKATLTAIKTALQQNNPKITTNDLQFIHLSVNTPGETLNTKEYISIDCTAIEGSVFDGTNIFVKLASQPSPAINLYNPVNILSVANNSNSDAYYYDDVFLKSLIYNPTNKTITSSASKLTDPQDEADYRAMLAVGNNITQGLTLLNRYLQNGFLQYNPQGHIPPRQALLEDSATNKQTVVTTNSALMNNGLTSSIDDYVKLDMHWDHVKLSLEWKLVNNLFINTINKAMAKFWHNTPVNEILTTQDEALLTMAFISNFLSTTEPWIQAIVAFISTAGGVVGLIISAILEVLTLITSAVIGNIMRQALMATFENKQFQYYFYNLPDSPQRPSGSGTPIFTLPKSTSLVLHYHLDFNLNYAWSFLSGHIPGSSMSAGVDWNPNVQIWNGLTPSRFNPSLKLTSAITGSYRSADDNNFTIAIGSDDLKSLIDAISSPDRFPTTLSIFHVLNWKTPDELQLGNNIPRGLWKQIEDTPQAWQIPQNYMAVIHAVNSKIAWSNFQTQADKTSLHEIHNEINTSFIKEDNSLNTLINSQNYTSVETRYAWLKTNWLLLKNTAPYKQYQSFAQAFQALVIDNSGVNIRGLDLTNASDWALFTNNLTILGNTFSNLIKTSPYHNNPNTILNIYYNPTLQTNVIIKPIN